MKIAISINTTWNIFNFRLGLIKILQEMGHELIAIAPADEYVLLLEKENVVCLPIKIDSKGTNAVEDLKLIRAYYKILKKIQPDIMLSYTIKPNIYGNFAAQVLGIKVVNNVSGLGTLFIEKSLSTKIAKTLYKIAFLRSNWVFFQNKEDQELFLKRKLVKNKFTSIIPGSGVNLSIFKSDRSNNKGIIILFVGRLIGDKGIREFINAAKILLKSNNNLQFKIVGEFGYNNRTAVTKEELDNWLEIDQIQYLGKVDNMQDVYAQTDIMVLPSYREGLSKSLIEACAMELPIVTTNVPGCRDVVDNGINGYLCEPKNSVDLASKISKIIELSEEHRVQMGKNARKIAVNKFDERIVISEYLKKIKLLSN